MTFSLFSPDNGLLSEARLARRRPSVPTVLLLFLATFAVGNIAAFPLAGAAAALAAALPPPLSETLPLLVSLAAALLPALAAMACCRYIERRPLRSLGFFRERAAAHYALGLLGGAAAIVLTAALCVFGGVRLTPDAGFSPVIALLFFFCYLLQGAGEEILLRGFLMLSLANRISAPAAVLINSVLFALLHIANPGVTPTALLNLTLFGLLASLMALRFENLWGVCAFHSAWNFLQGCILGFPVSGLLMPARLFVPLAPAKAVWLHGGSFGPEGGLSATVVLIAGILSLLFSHRAAGRRPF